MRDPLSIGIVCFPSLGGSGVIASELALGLARRGHRVHLMASARPSRDLPPCPNETFHEIRVPPYPLFEHAPYTIAVASTIVDVARTHGLDLVQVHYAVPHAASAQLARQVLGKDGPALITSLHGTDVMRVGSDPAYRAITAHAVATSDGITVPSAYLRDEARRRFGLHDEHPVDILPNFVDTWHFAPAPARDRGKLAALFRGTTQAVPADGPILFHVSNFREVKRVGDLMEVLARVRRVTPARLVLVGDGPSRCAAADRAEDLGLSDAVVFLGRQTEFVDLLAHADAFVLTSETESFGLAALEALSTGVPVCAYRVGGVPEVVAPGTGRLVDPFDMDQLALAIVDVVGDPARRDAMGRAARAHAVAHFGEEPALDRYEDYFRRIVARAGSGKAS